MGHPQSIFNKPVVYNIGYQYCDIKKFIAKLKANEVDKLIDLREKPYSRNRDFAREPFRRALKQEGIAYLWMGALLGGLTCPRESWLIGCRRIAQMAVSETLAMMCMEDDYNQCHRKALAEILAEEFKVHNINL